MLNSLTALSAGRVVITSFIVEILFHLLPKLLPVRFLQVVAQVYVPDFIVFNVPLQFCDNLVVIAQQRSTFQSFISMFDWPFAFMKVGGLFGWFKTIRLCSIMSSSTRAPFSSIASACHSTDFAFASSVKSSFSVGKQLIRRSIRIRNLSRGTEY